MTSLQAIMNLDDDQLDAASPLDKRDKDASTPASDSRARESSTTSSIPSVQVTRSDPVPSSYPSSSAAQPNPSTHPLPIGATTSYSRQQLSDPADSRSAVQQGKRPVESGTVQASASILSTTATRPGGVRRQSSTSVDSMDQHGYGSAAGSSSMGGGGGGIGYLPNQPRRPMGSPSPDVPIRLTPITGRVSRAKKGVPVHVCDTCIPPKTFTRAEHLRRHQLSHQQPQYGCDRCDRVFHRLDLLTRHQQRHNEETDRPSPRGGLIRRDSRDSATSSTLEERMPGLTVTNLQQQQQQPMGYATSSQGLVGHSTPSSGGEIVPSPPPTGSHPGSNMSPAPGPSENYGPSPGQGSGSGGNYTHYRVSGLTMSGNNNIESSPEPAPLTDSSFAAPRTAPMPALFVNTTQGLASSTAVHTSLDNVPELSHATDYSPWTSASESTYSNGSEVPRRRHWRHVHHSSLDWQTSAGLMPAMARRELATGGVDLETMTATPYYMPATTFPMSPHMAPPQTAYHPLLNEQPQSFLDQSAPPASMTASGTGSDALVTPALLPPHPISALSMARRKEMVILDDGNGDSSPHWPQDDSTGVVGGSGVSTLADCSSMNATHIPAPLPRSVRNAIPGYLEVYWKRFDRLHPVVHRPTFEAQGGQDDVLRCAMAAIGTQFLSGKEDRIRGSQLHEHAWQEVKKRQHHPEQWNLQIMQAILLCEYFARFRGRKPAVRPSKTFENLYMRVHGLPYNPNDLYDAALAPEQRWREWLEAEGRRRLLAGCFMVDSHAAIFHQQPRAREDIDPTTITLTGRSDSLWAATSADEWAVLEAANPAASQPRPLPGLDTLRAEDIDQFSLFDQACLLNAAALSLPRRHTALPQPDDRLAQLFASSTAAATTANVYVALHHTPLHDLLAVSGDSWIFSQKVLGEPTFLEHRKRLKAWIEGRDAAGLCSAKAIVHAARALTSYLDDNNKDNKTMQISDYWGLYVCALIVWAFGHRSSSSKPSTGSASSPSRGAMSEDEAVTWLRHVGELVQTEQQVVRMRGRREASAAVVSMVKTRLEADCVGGRSRLYLDAVTNLRKLEEGVNWRWF